MNRSAWSCARVMTWVVAVFAAANASRGLLELAPGTGVVGLLAVGGSWLVFGFVAACIIAGAESLLPGLRRHARPRV